MYHFEGISENGLEILKLRLNSYIQKLNNKIDEFDATVPVTGAYKGTVENSVVEYLNAVKKTLKDYIQKMQDVELKEVNTALEKYHSIVDESAKSTASSAADEVRGRADSLSLD